MFPSSRLLLRAVECRDINDNYFHWFNNPEVIGFLESRFLPQSFESLIEYWDAHHDRSDRFSFAICITSDGRHIGNIKLGPINRTHRQADISFVIGEPGFWSQGYASKAVEFIKNWAFSELGLQKLNAGIYAVNIGSKHVLEKCGFSLEGTLWKDVQCMGQRIDVLRYGLLHGDWRSAS